MKKITTLLLSVTLSMMIVALSAGVAFVYCAHSGTTTWAMASAREYCDDAPQVESCCDAEAGTQLDAPDCMTVKVMRLAPTVTSAPILFCFHNLPQAVPSFLQPLFRCSPLWLPLVRAERWGGGFRSPPRSYLRILRVLRL